MTSNLILTVTLVGYSVPEPIGGVIGTLTLNDTTINIDGTNISSTVLQLFGFVESVNIGAQLLGVSIFVNNGVDITEYDNPSAYMTLSYTGTQEILFDIPADPMLPYNGSTNFSTSGEGTFIEAVSIQNCLLVEMTLTIDFTSEITVGAYYGGYINFTFGGEDYTAAIYGQFIINTNTLTLTMNCPN